MEQLNWEQTQNNLFVIIEHKGKKIKFKIDDRILIPLIANTPRFYDFIVTIDSVKTEYEVDFNDLKPIVKSTGKLKISSNKNVAQIVEVSNSFGTYVIARGESYMERFLGVNGWQTQEYFFGIIPLDEKLIPQMNKTQEKIIQKENEKIKENNPQLNNISTNLEKVDVIVNKSVNASKLQECKKCKNIVPSDFDMCPFCFSQLIELEEGVDFII